MEIKFARAVETGPLRLACWSTEEVFYLPSTTQRYIQRRHSSLRPLRKDFLGVTGSPEGCFIRQRSSILRGSFWTLSVPFDFSALLG
ncbi:hypothetical protein TNCV_4631491 [Trichonephila clavipes]|nr:hypothetical protein TNCV_4631491 [Trichonephila clavipes]